jgi:arylformamidase
MTMDRRRLLFTALALGVAGPASAQDRPRRRGGGLLQGLRDRRRDPADGASSAPHTEISTGPDPMQAYDLYRPARGEGPVLAFVHGGGWRHGDKAMVHALPEYAERHGLTFASIGYRLVPRVTPREQAEDVAAAVADLMRRHSRRPLYLMGHSAGAHLAALVGIDPVYLGAHGVRTSDLAGVIPLDGAGYDATQPRPRGVEGRILGDLYEEAFGDQAAELSPTLRVRQGQAYAPYLIFHIESRDNARQQSNELARVLRRAGGQAEVVVAPGDSHRDINVEFGATGDAEGERAARFILSGRL